MLPRVISKVKAPGGIEIEFTPEGTCLFTAPASEWAERFRASAARREAEFQLSDGTTVTVPSTVLSLEDQVSLMATSGMEVAEVENYTSADLVSSQSKKLDVFDESTNAPVLRGFAVRKNRRPFAITRHEHRA